MFNFSPNSYQKSIEPQITTKNGILVAHSIVGMSFFFYYRTHLMVLGLDLSFDDSQVVLSLCSLNIVAPRLAYLELHRIIYWVL
jgi:hypothetical protein